MSTRLKTLILQELQKKPNSGYGLIKDIEQNTGWKPSYGSIHPQLNKLEEETLIQKQQKENKNIWHLTAKGLKATKKPSPELIARLKEDMNLLSHICGVDQEAHQEITNMFISSLERGEQPFSEVQEELTQLQQTLWKLYEQDNVQKNKDKINNIIRTTTNELKKL